MSIALVTANSGQIVLVHDGSDPIQIGRHFGVDSRPAGSGAAVPVARDTGQHVVAVVLLTHERSARIAQTGVSASSLVTRAEHVLRYFVQREEDGALATLFRRQERHWHFLQRVSCVNKFGNNRIY
jgi:hypothetical protein